MRVPECFVPGFRDYLEKAVTRAVRRAAHILADSSSTRQDLIQLLGVSESQVSVLYPGVEPRFRPISDVDSLEGVRARYGLPPRFILGLGTLQPRKNFVALVEAFARCLAHSHPAIEDVHLVIVGGKGWMAGDIPAAVSRLGVGERVQIAGFVDDGDLPALYNLARAFAFPSLYEGFGLPVAEAMACGFPVVAADNSSLPEVVGDAGLLVGAADRDALAGALFRLLTDQDLRARLSVSGREQVSRFSWDAAARQLLDTYQIYALSN
jgi:glycosyltransferase involved in cell wall biosynthesis